MPANDRDPRDKPGDDEPDEAPETPPDEPSPPRVEAHITFVPSRVNTGSTSAPAWCVSRAFFFVSMSIQYRS